MNSKWFRIWFLLAFNVLLLSGLGVGLQYVRPTAAASNAAAASALVSPYVAVMGTDVDVDQTVANFLSDGRLIYVRDHFPADSYYDELPADPYGGFLPSGFVLRMYQVMTNSTSVGTVISDVVTEAANYSSVETVSGDLSALSYLPTRLVLYGECSEIDIIANTFDLATVDAFSLTAASGGCEKAVHYTAFEASVHDMVSTINANLSWDNSYAQPNYLMAGHMDHFIFGAPSAMIAPSLVTGTTPASPLTTKGLRTAVFIFDTSPWANATSDTFSELVNGKVISVNHQIQMPSDLPESFAPTVGSHGTFVATPMTQLAPDADIFLIRTLNLSGVGDEFTLSLAIDKMTKLLQSNNNDYDGVIFNYSLGRQADSLLGQETLLYRIASDTYNNGIIQIAASGNNSAFESAPLSATMPAAHPAVIGVTSVSVSGGISCYANQGDIAAPGGGNARGGGACDVQKMVEECAFVGAPGCVTGYDPWSSTQLASGVGTSFAAPVVSGIVAQLIEAIVSSAPPPAASASADAASVPNNWVSPDNVWSELQNMASSGGSGTGVGSIGSYGTPTAVEMQQQSTNDAIAPTLLVIAAVTLILISLVLIGRRCQL